MAKYDWEKLKREYITGNFKSLKVFAEEKGIKYGFLRQKAADWNEQKRTKDRIKTNKIIEKVTEKQTEREIDYLVDLAALSSLAAKRGIEILSKKELTASQLKNLTSAIKDISDIEKARAAGSEKHFEKLDALIGLIDDETKS